MFSLCCKPTAAEGDSSSSPTLSMDGSLEALRLYLGLLTRLSTPSPLFHPLSRVSALEQLAVGARHLNKTFQTAKLSGHSDVVSTGLSIVTQLITFLEDAWALKDSNATNYGFLAVACANLLGQVFGADFAYSDDASQLDSLQRTYMSMYEDLVIDQVLVRLLVLLDKAVPDWGMQMQQTEYSLGNLVITAHKILASQPATEGCAAALALQLVKSSELRACLSAIPRHFKLNPKCTLHQSVSITGAISTWLRCLFVPNDWWVAWDNSLSRDVMENDLLDWVLEVQAASVEVQAQLLDSFCYSDDVEKAVAALGIDYKNWALPDLLHTIKVADEYFKTTHQSYKLAPFLDIAQSVVAQALEVAHAIMASRDPGSDGRRQYKSEMEHPLDPGTRDYSSDNKALASAEQAIQLCMICLEASTLESPGSVNACLQSMQHGGFLRLLQQCICLSATNGQKLERLNRAAEVINLVAQWWRPEYLDVEDVEELALTGRQALVSLLAALQSQLADRQQCVGEAGTPEGSPSTINGDPLTTGLCRVMPDLVDIAEVMSHLAGAVHNLSWSSRRRLRSTHDACMQPSPLCGLLQCNWLPFITAIIEVILQTAVAQPSDPQVCKKLVPVVNRITCMLDVASLTAIELVDGNGKMPWQSYWGGNPAGLQLLASILRFYSVALKDEPQGSVSIDNVLDLSAASVRILDTRSPLQLRKSGSLGSKQSETSTESSTTDPSSYIGPAWVCSTWGFACLSVWVAASDLKAACTHVGSPLHCMASSAFNACSASAMQLLLRAAEQLLVDDMDEEPQKQPRNAAVAASGDKPAAVASYITSSARKSQLARLDSAREKLSLQRSAIESSAMLTFITNDEERKAMEIAMNVCLTRTKHLARMISQLLYEHSPEAMQQPADLTHIPCARSPFSTDVDCGIPKREPTTIPARNKAESVNVSPAGSRQLDVDDTLLKVSNSAEAAVHVSSQAVTPTVTNPSRKLPPGQLSLSLTSTPTKAISAVRTIPFIADSWTVAWYEHPLSWIQWEANLHKLPRSQRGCSNPMCVTDSGCSPVSCLDACKGCSVACFCCDACHDKAVTAGLGHAYTCSPLQAAFASLKPKPVPEDTLLYKPYAPPNSLVEDSPPS